jgi:DNA-binding XRE family transcriptional regulator
MDIRELRRMARLTQIELAHLTGINRVKLSFAECHYVTLTAQEESSIREAIAEAVESQALRVRNAARVERMAGAMTAV